MTSERTYAFAIGRTKSGDQLHKCTVTITDGKVGYGGCNAHCNNHSHLRPVSGWKGEKAEIVERDNLFCKKCFGTATQVGRDYVNATVIGKKIAVTDAEKAIVRMAAEAGIKLEELK